jgi:spore coat assembly protein
MIKHDEQYQNIYNYRNSRHFIETVKQARKYDEIQDKNLVIFAGACQSYFEALMEAGANFASSPARILIDFLDPLIVAKSVAVADKNKYITIDDFVNELRDGKKGVNGLGARGKKNVIFL